MDNAISILDFHRDRLRRKRIERGQDDDERSLRSSGLKGFGELLRQIAKFEAGYSETDLDELKDFIAMVTPDDEFGMSQKNRTRLTALLEQPTYAMLLALPQHLMNGATKLLDEATMTGRAATSLEAARLAMYATALEILLFLPLRRKNLLTLSLDINLRRPNPRGLIVEIFVPAQSVKNKKAIYWPVEPASARLIDLYIKKFRPLLAADTNQYLFPGIGESHRNEAEFGDRLSKLVASKIRAEFNCHLVRHFAAVRYLRQHPGHYEVVANILGHRSTTTTQKFYCGLEIDAAARHANGLLTTERRRNKTIAIGAYHRGAGAAHRSKRVVRVMSQ